MNIKKVTVNLPADQVEFLQELAKRDNLTFTDVLRRSISSEKFFVTQEDAKKKILVEDPATSRIQEVLRHR